MTSTFNVLQNISFLDRHVAKIRHRLNLVFGIVKYVKTFGNFGTVIRCYMKNNFPVTGILRDGQKIILRNQMHASLVAFLRNDIPIKDDFVILHVMNRDVMLSGWENNTGVSELFVQDCYGMLDVQNKTVIDIGANIGDSAIYFILKGAKKVIGYEPSFLNYEHAISNINKNNMNSSIDIIRGAVGPTETEITIDEKSDGSGFRLTDVSGGQGKVHVTTLDKICNQVGDANLVLKMDCESCEYDVILDAEKDTLRRFERIYLEYHYGYKNLKKKLEECGFEIIITKKPVLMNPIHHYYLGELMAIRK